MPKINWDIASPPTTTPPPPGYPFVAKPAAVALATEVDGALTKFAGKLAELADHGVDAIDPTYRAQAFVVGFLRAAEVSGIDLTDLALINPFAFPLHATTFDQALRLTTADRNASVVRAEEFRSMNPGLI